MKQEIRKNNKTRQDFLLTFFGDFGYEEKHVNGYWLVKQWNGNMNTWQVAIYEEGAFQRYKTLGSGNNLKWIYEKRAEKRV